MVLGAVLGALPAFAWYSTTAPGGRVTVSGFGGAGELWLLPVLGGLSLLAGAGLLSAGAEGIGQTSRWAGPLALAAGALGLAWALRAGLDPRVTLSVVQDGARHELASPVHIEPATVVAPLVAGAIALVGALVTWSGWPSGGGAPRR